MHDTAFEIGRHFLETHARSGSIVLEIGSLNVNGSLRDVCPDGATYLGLDFEHGDGVDIFCKPGEPFPVRDGFCDLLISTSQMEHDSKFWKTFLEFCRLTKAGGKIYINTPSNGSYHAYPRDVWRFYPDAGLALTDWANDCGEDITLLESFTAHRQADQWNDFVAVFHKGRWPQDQPVPFISDIVPAYNVRKFGVESLIRQQALTEDGEKLRIAYQEIARLQREVEDVKAQLEAARQVLPQPTVAAGPDAVVPQLGTDAEIA